MKIEKGDSVILGKEWCKLIGPYRYKRYTGKPILLTYQVFEEDNGLYCYDSECLGIYIKKAQEAFSIYHLFGNHFEDFMDCTLIKATEESLRKFNKIEKKRLSNLNEALAFVSDPELWKEYEATLDKQPTTMKT